MYIKIQLDCDRLISAQLISNSSAKFCNNNAKICNKLIRLVEKNNGI